MTESERIEMRKYTKMLEDREKELMEFILPTRVLPKAHVGGAACRGYGKSNMKRKIEAVDLFCGAGGLTYGMRQAGINVLAGLDNDPTCKKAYETNNQSKFINADITEYDFGELKKKFSKNSIKILAGCAPCQPFSSHSHKYKIKDDRWQLIKYLGKAVKVINPEVISVENVAGFTKTRMFEEFIIDMENAGYEIDYKIVFCPDYGVPQRRKRLVLIGSKIGLIEIPKTTHGKQDYVNVEDTIKDLSSLEAGELDQKDALHRSQNLSKLNLKRIRQSKPGGTWKDWDKKLLPNCYLKCTGQTYTSVYGRMKWNDVAPTITTQFFNYGSGRFGHPEQDRALTLKEGALLQTFPKDYYFCDNLPISVTARHIGNAVPPKLGKVIGKKILEHVNDEYCV